MKSISPPPTPTPLVERGEYYTVAGLAARWQVTPRHIHNIMSRGEIKVLHLGRAVRIPFKEVLIYEALNLR